MHSKTRKLPPWVVLHLPHSSTLIPQALRDQFLVSDEELAQELAVLTDQYVEELFLDTQRPHRHVKSKVSRLVVDMERFLNDAHEPASRVGFGAIYSRTLAGKPLRRALTYAQRAGLERKHEAHHARLGKSITTLLRRYELCLVLDCHTFPEQRVPFETGPADAERPDICIGTDPFHTPTGLAQAFVRAFQAQGWTVALNQPFAGALVPSSHYLVDARVSAIMIEVNRRICHDETGPVASSDHAVARRVRQACADAVLGWQLGILAAQLEAEARGQLEAEAREESATWWLPANIPMVRYQPKRPAFAMGQFDPTAVLASRDLPPYLQLGPLDAASFHIADGDWRARYKGIEVDTAFEIAYSHKQAQYTFAQTWCGTKGLLSVAAAEAPLHQVAKAALCQHFPADWDSQAKQALEEKYQLHYVPHSKQVPALLSVTDGALQTIAIPIAVANLRQSMARVQELVAKARFSFALRVEAKLVEQTVNYISGLAPEWTQQPDSLLEHSVAATGTPPGERPCHDHAGDNSKAWSVRRPHYLLCLTVPFAGLKYLISRLAERAVGLLQKRGKETLPCEQLPLVFPANLPEAGITIQLWDRKRTTRSCWRLADPYARPVAAPAAGRGLAEADTEQPLRAAEQCSAVLRAAAAAERDRLIEVAAEKWPRELDLWEGESDYMLYQDHVGWVITTGDMYRHLQRIYRALKARTWGEFYDLLPSSEWDDIVCRDPSEFAPELGGEERYNSKGNLVRPRGVITRGMRFSSSDVPGVDEGDYPPWPANIGEFSDKVCKEAYERFGKRESGFVHTFCHIRDELLEATESWLAANGHTVERRNRPSAE